MSVLLRLSEERFGSEMGNIRNWWRQFFLEETLIFNFKVAANLGWNVDAVTKIRQQARHNFVFVILSLLFVLTALQPQQQSPVLVAKANTQMWSLSWSGLPQVQSAFLPSSSSTASSTVVPQIEDKQILKSHLKFKSSNISETICIPPFYASSAVS
jgi:hypothetical protein